MGPGMTLPTMWFLLPLLSWPSYATAATFCESKTEHYLPLRSSRDSKFRNEVTVDGARFFNSSIINYNWQWFQMLMLSGAEVSVSDLSLAMDNHDCVMTLWGDSVVFILSRMVGMEHLIGSTTVVSQCSVDTLKLVCESFVKGGACFIEQNCVVMGHLHRPSEREVGRIRLCHQDFHSFFRRTPPNRSFNVLEMGLFTDDNSAQLIDLTGKGVDDFCMNELNGPHNMEVGYVLQSIWPLLRRFMTDKVDDLLNNLANDEHRERDGHCHWDGSTDLMVYMRQLRTDSDLGRLINATLDHIQAENNMDEDVHATSKKPVPVTSRVHLHSGDIPQVSSAFMNSPTAILMFTLSLL